MAPLIITVGNIYLDHNVFGIKAGDEFLLKSGKDYFGTHGETVLGGSAVNVAIQMRRLGLEVGFIGKTGKDIEAKEIFTLLDAKGINHELIAEDPASGTSMAVNLVDRKGEFIGLHYGDASKSLGIENINLDHNLFDRCTGIHFSGTAKQKYLFADCRELFEVISKRGIKVFYDPNRFPAHEQLTDKALLQEQWPYVDVYFPNEEELLQAADLQSVDEALDKVIRSGVKVIALKKGAEGCRIKTPAEDFVVSGKKVNTLSTVGAGDCFNATFIASYLSNMTLRECAERAVAASALKVLQNIWPGEDEINKMLAHD